MPTYSGSYWRDANRVPVTTYGFKSQKSQTLSGNNTTVATALFSVTGTVLIKALYGIVTTALGSNVTAAYWRTNDQTAQLSITLSSGTTISSAAIGSMINRLTVAGTALIFDNASAAKVRDPVAATAPDVFMPFIVIQKTAAVETDIEFVYSTTNTPTSGVIQHNLQWLPLSDDGNVTVL